MEAQIPASRCLFKSIDWLYKLAHLIGILLVFKTFGLCHKHILFEFSVKESGFNIHLPYFIIIKRSYGKEYPNRFNLSDWREGFIIINPVGLSLTFCHKSSIECAHIPIHVSLLLEDPLTTYCLMTRCRFNQIPNLVVFHGPNFAVHCHFPLSSLRACHDFFVVRRLIQMDQCFITDKRVSSRSDVETINCGGLLTLEVLLRGNETSTGSTGCSTSGWTLVSTIGSLSVDSQISSRSIWAPTDFSNFFKINWAPTDSLRYHFSLKEHSFSSYKYHFSVGLKNRYPKLSCG